MTQVVHHKKMNLIYFGPECTVEWLLFRQKKNEKTKTAIYNSI